MPTTEVDCFALRNEPQWSGLQQGTVDVIQFCHDPERINKDVLTAGFRRLEGMEHLNSRRSLLIDQVDV